MIPYVVKGQLDSLEKELEAKIDNASSEPKSVTYDELVDLAHSSKLIVGKEYRITDYCTTILEENAADPDCEFGISPYKSAKHPFDIIVTAIAKNKVGFKAKAAVHEGDEYFANSHLEQWEVTYELERPQDDRGLYDIPENGEYIISTNDAWTVYPFVEERDDGPSWMPHYYVWFDGWWDHYFTEKRHPEIGDDAFMEDDLSQETRPEEPSGGTIAMYKKEHYTGRIFFLKDEFNNCANYDFKNIMTHSRAIASDGDVDVTKCLDDRYYYLFDENSTTESDLSVMGNRDGYYRCCNNRICINDSSERIDSNSWYFGRIVIACWSIGGVNIEALNAARTENIVISYYKGTSSCSAKNVHIGSKCSSIILSGSGRYPEIEANIGTETQNVIFEGCLNGSLNIGCGCNNIKVYGIKISESATSSQTAVSIGDNCRNITLGTPDTENANIQGSVVIGNRCYNITLPCFLSGISLANWCKDIVADAPNSDGKFIYLENISLGNRCQSYTFKLGDTRGSRYSNINGCEGSAYITFDQDNTGKGVCQSTIVQNIFIAPGFQSVCNTKDARFDPVSGSNVNNGQTYFTIDANKDAIMYWFNSGITMAGKKWDKTTSVWVAL